MTKIEEDLKFIAEEWKRLYLEKVVECERLSNRIVELECASKK